jgi:tetratricopeptide (TPR) repeat protein
MEHVDESTPLEIRAGLLWGLGGFAWSQGDLTRAITNLDESVRLARMTNDKYLLANILIVRGLAATSAHEVQAANEMFEESIRLLQALNEKWGQSLALSWMGDVALVEKDFERARALHEQAIAVAREQGDPWIFLSPLMSGGNSAMIAGSPEKAEAISFEAISLLREIDDKWSLAWGLNSLGHAALQLDHLEVARASFEECITVARNIGNPGALIASFLGAAMLTTRLFQKARDDDGKEQTIRLMNAIRLLGVIPSLNQNLHMFFWVGWGSDVYEQAMAQARGLTTDETWETSFAEGETLSLPQALSIALQELGAQ